LTNTIPRNIIFAHDTLLRINSGEEVLTMSTQAHPVWHVYDLYRTARLNVKYYSAGLNRLKRKNLYLEIMLAAFVSLSAIGVFGFWETTTGKEVWQFLVGVSVFLAVIKPILSLAERIRLQEEIISGYRTIDIDLHKITVQIHHDRKYTTTHRIKYEVALDRMGELVKMEPKTEVDNKLKEKCEQEVINELPDTIFFVPSVEE